VVLDGHVVDDEFVGPVLVDDDVGIGRRARVLRLGRTGEVGGGDGHDASLVVLEVAGTSG